MNQNFTAFGHVEFSLPLIIFMFGQVEIYSQISCDQQDCRKSSDEVLRDINVVPVYYKHNLFGKGVKVIVVDDGVETTHEDLKDNYVSWPHTYLPIYRK